jgi:hypothetical protein
VRCSCRGAFSLFMNSFLSTLNVAFFLAIAFSPLTQARPLVESLAQP